MICECDWLIIVIIACDDVIISLRSIISVYLFVKVSLFVFCYDAMMVAM